MKHKKLGSMAVLLLLAVSVAAVTFATGNYYNVRRIGPYYTSTMPFDSTAIGGTGGSVSIYLAGDTELVGNVVYLSAKNTVAHSATLANYNSVAGVVVGGTITNMQASGDSSSVGDTAAFNGGRVIVATQGRAWVKTDTGAGFAPGTMVIPSSRAGSGGRVSARTTAIDTFYRALGIILDSGVTNSKHIIALKVK